MTGNTPKDMGGYGLIMASHVSRVVAGGAAFLYLRAVLEPVFSLFLVFSSLKQAIHGLSLRTTFTESLILSLYA